MALLCCYSAILLARSQDNPPPPIGANRSNRSLFVPTASAMTTQVSPTSLLRRRRRHGVGISSILALLSMSWIISRSHSNNSNQSFASSSCCCCDAFVVFVVGGCLASASSSPQQSVTAEAIRPRRRARPRLNTTFLLPSNSGWILLPSHQQNSRQPTSPRVASQMEPEDTLWINGGNSARREGGGPSTAASAVGDYELRFGGVGRLYGNADAHTTTATTTAQPGLILQRLQNSTVVLIGLGGVGSWAAEAVARSGVGCIVLVDLDDVCISNTNRQLHALSTTVGQMKIDVLRDRLLGINPDCLVHLVHDFVSVDNVNELFDAIDKALLVDNRKISAVLELIDGATEKSAILAMCYRRKLPVVTCGGAAGRKDPTQIVCTDLTVSEGDKLLAAVRHNLRRHHAFPEGYSASEQRRGKRSDKWRIDCVYSTELVPDSQKNDAVTPPTLSNLRQCDGALGTASFVTGTFGFTVAAKIVNKIANGSLVPPRKGWQKPKFQE
jgi:tRNA threonylcarbamoyladenosine dehydratase